MNKHTLQEWFQESNEHTVFNVYAYNVAVMRPRVFDFFLLTEIRDKLIVSGKRPRLRWAMEH